MSYTTCCDRSHSTMEDYSSCCPLRGRVRYNSAFRLCYSLQLLPCYNEKHQLIPVYPRPHTQQCKLRKQQQHNSMASNASSKHNHNHNHNNLQHTTAARTYSNNSTSRRGGGGGSTSGNGAVPRNGDGGRGSGPTRIKVDPNKVYSILWLPVVVASATIGLYALSRVFLEAAGNGHQLKFPKSIEDIRDMTEFLLSAKKNHPFHLLMLFSAGYIYKQSFAVPGSVFLNLLAGALFGPYIGFILTCTLTAIGATCCYLLSRTFGMAHVVKYFPDRVRFFQEKVESNKDSLFFFLLFLRLFPMTPNWAINMISPIVGVPIHLFFFSVFIGLMPYNFICVQTGDVLSQISSINDVLDIWTMAKMACVALVALMPGVAIKWFKVKQD